MKYRHHLLSQLPKSSRGTTRVSADWSTEHSTSPARWPPSSATRGDGLQGCQGDGIQGCQGDGLQACQGDGSQGCQGDGQALGSNEGKGRSNGGDLVRKPCSQSAR